MKLARLYPAKMTGDGDALLVTFRDVPECHTQGEDDLDAVTMAADALYTVREFYLEHGRKMQEPSSIEDGEVLVPLYVEDEAEELKLFGVLAVRHE